MSLLGNGVTFGKNGGGNVQLGGVADPTSAQQVATKNYVDTLITSSGASYVLSSEKTFSPGLNLVSTGIQDSKISKILSSFSYFSDATDANLNMLIPFCTYFYNSQTQQLTRNLYFLNTSTTDITTPAMTRVETTLYKRG